MKTSFNEYINEGKLTLPHIPNTMNFWHGGDLDKFDDVISHKNGRYEYGAGLYITTHYGTAQRYSKGSRKLYLITVEKGVDINDALLKPKAVQEFINKFVIGRLKKEIWNRVQKYMKDDKIKAYIFDNIILNEKAIKSTNTRYLRQFYIDNGIDYNMINSPFGWGEKMMVLYNMDKIVKTVRIMPTDEIEVYDLPTEFY